MMEWISVKDRLPQACSEVFVFTSNAQVSVGYLEGKEWIPTDSIIPTYDYSRTMFYGTITHWMPLIDSPKQ